MNGFRCALAMFSGRIILNFGISERLRAFRYPIFTGGVVEKNSICSAAFCESAALQENLLPAFSRLNRYVTISPLRPLCVKMRLEHSAECDKRKNKNNRTAIYAQSKAEGILNRFVCPKGCLRRNSRRPFPLLHPAICAIVTTFREKVSPSRWRNAKGGRDGKELLYRIIFYRKYGKNLLQIDNKRCIIYKWLWKPDTSSTDRLSLPVLRILCRRR